MHLQTLGSLQLHPADLKPLKQRLLLALLAAEGPLERAQLRNWLWPDVADPATNLRMTLARIEASAPGAIKRDGRQLILAIDSDLGALQKALQRADAETLLTLYQGAFLQNLVLPPELDLLEDWVQRTQRRVADEVRSVLLVQTELGRQPFDAQMAERLYKLPGSSPLSAEEIRRIFVLLSTSGRASQPQVAAVPSPSTAPAPAPSGTELPRPRTSFFGREQIITEMLTQLRTGPEQLMTVLGPGGTGKTRLATEVARRLGTPPTPFEAVVYVALGDLSAPERLFDAVASVLKLPLPLGASAFELVRLHFKAAATLLILDNFEQLTEAAPDLQRLLDASPNLKVVVTSRTRLRLPSEWCLPLPGLPTKSTAGRSEAVQLFVARARRIRPSFLPTPLDLKIIDRIAVQMEGSPLGLELTAAWMWTMTLLQVESALQEDALFREALPGVKPAHKGQMSELLQRSWTLLDSQERAVLQGSAVFHGGFTVSAALEVLEASPHLLAGLVDRSLLRVDAAGRFDQHPLLLAFSRQQLNTWPDIRAAVEARHAHWLSDFARPLAMQTRRKGSSQVMTLLETEYLNCVQVLEWATRTGEPATVVGLGAVLFDYWILRVADPRAPAWLMTALAHPRLGPDETRVLGLWVTGALLNVWGRSVEARPILEELRDLSRTLALPMWEGHALSNLGSVALMEGRYSEAKVLYQQSLKLHQEVGVVETGPTLNRLGDTEMSLGNWAAARLRYEEVLEVTLQTGNQKERIRALRKLGEWHLVQEAQALGRRWLLEAFSEAEKSGFVSEQILCLDGVAVLLARQGAWSEAVQAWGAWEAGLIRQGLVLRGIEAEWSRQVRLQAQTHLGASAFAEALQMGREKPFQEVPRLCPTRMNSQ